MRIDPLAVIERAYDVEADERAWLEGVLESAAPAVDEGHGLLAYYYDASVRPLRIWDVVGAFGPTTEDLVDVVTSVDDDFVAGSYPVTPFATTSELPGFDRHPTFGPRLHPYGIHDAIGVNAFDPSGRGAWIGALLSERRTVTAEERDRWAKISMHLAAALRLRRRLQGADAGTAAEKTADAIVSPSGKVESVTDAAGAARTALSAAVVRLEHARGRLRRTQPDEAVAAWEVLVRARWSLVDHFESDGRRYILAHENVRSRLGPETLTEREREVVGLTALGHSPKLIAYDLGLAASTVRVHLTNASRKLGVRSREALVTKYRDWLSRPRR